MRRRITSDFSANSSVDVFMHTEGGIHRIAIEVADRFHARLCGLMFRPPLRHQEAFLLSHCSSVHSCFMRHAIDVVYLDSTGKVLKCVEFLRPWRMSHGVLFSAGLGLRMPVLRVATHTLELAAGSIRRMAIVVGSQLHHPALLSAAERQIFLPTRLPGASCQVEPTKVSAKQKGSAMIEFAIVAPIITLLGLATLQYGLLFFAKNQYNHAVFMAARAGSTGNANFAAIEKEYARALVPVYGGGTTGTDIAASYTRALTDVQANALIEVLNPTAESFADFNDPSLSARIGNGKRVIPNGGQLIRSALIVRAASGQNIQDANLLKLRITHGFKPQVPLIGFLYTRYLQWLDTGANPFNTAMIASQRIPVVSHVTVQMQSDAIEDRVVSTPGLGNGGATVNPSELAPIPAAPPPRCQSTACGTLQSDLPSGGGGGATNESQGTDNTGSLSNPGSGAVGSPIGPDTDGSSGGVCVVPDNAI